MEEGVLDFKNHRLCIVALSVLPNEACWGPKTSSEDLSNVVCWWSRPLTVWVIGHLVEIEYTFSPKDPRPRLSMRVGLLRPVDKQASMVHGSKFRIPIGTSYDEYQA